MDGILANAGSWLLPLAFSLAEILLNNGHSHIIGSINLMEGPPSKENRSCSMPIPVIPMVSRLITIHRRYSYRFGSGVNSADAGLAQYLGASPINAQSWLRLAWCEKHTD
jgi:hypothetical protein